MATAIPPILSLCSAIHPFILEGFPANGLTCTTIPVRRVVLIAFLAMEVSVDPRTLGAFVLLCRLVGSRPIALRVPPKSGECVGESGWRLGRG
jgi:hypothetical protein